MDGGAPKVVGVLLAAGAGRRYGMPKVLVNGWLSTAVTALRDGGCAHVVVVLGAAEVPAPADATTVTATDWHTGGSASLRTGLNEADRMGADYAVVHVIDTPDIGPAVVARVLSRAIESAGGAARATFGGQFGAPVVLGRRHWAPVLASASGDEAATHYLDTNRDVESVDCSDLASGRDYDEPAEDLDATVPD